MGLGGQRRSCILLFLLWPYSPCSLTLASLFMGGGFSTRNVFPEVGGLSVPHSNPQPGGPRSLLLLLPFLRGDDPVLRCQIVALTSPLMGLGFVDDVDRQSLLTTAFPSA